MGCAISGRRRNQFKVFWFITFFIILLSGCQTLSVSQEESKRETDVLNTQKSLVVSFLNKGLPEMAVKELRGLIARYPEDADFKNLMGLSQLALKNPKEAIPYLKEAYQLAPRPSFALNLSSAYIESGQYDQSVAVLMKMQKAQDFKEYPHPERVSHNLGLAAERRRHYKVAEKHYLKALSVNPSFYISLMRLGQLYEKTNKNGQALSYYQRARKVWPHGFDPVNALAMAYLAEGKKPLALKTIKAYLAKKELAPQDRVRATKLLDTARRASEKGPVAR